MFRKYNFIFLSLVLGSIALVPAVTSAAVLSLESSRSSLAVGESALVTLRLNAEGQPINTVGGKVRLSTNTGQVTSVNTGDSFISLWVERPSVGADGRVIFTGGVPGGFSGSSGTITSFVVMAKAPGQINLALEDIQILLNDGQGTALKDFTLRPLVLNVSSAPVGAPVSRPKDQPSTQAVVESDLVPPEDFIPLISRHPSVADNRYFVSFFAIDKGTGIKSYEVSEAPRIFFYPLKFLATGWEKTESPYVLKRQWWSTRVLVRAYDGAGNYLETYADKPLSVAAWMTLIVVLLALVILVKWRRRPAKRRSRRLVVGLLLAGSLWAGMLGFDSVALAQTPGQPSMLISPADGQYQVGDLFSVLLNIDTAGQAINAASGQLNFDPTHLRVESLGYSKSLFTFWAEEPRFSNLDGTISFSGGLPSPGYNGRAGTVLRITLKAVAPGQAPLSFITGTLLANDGRGTNVLDNLKGGLYGVTLAEAPGPTAPTPKIISGDQVGSQLAVPILTDVPTKLEEGETLIVRGLGDPNGKTVVFFQKDAEQVLSDEVYAALDGRFVSTFKLPVRAGLYRVWAKSINLSGVSSSPSEIAIVQVVEPLYFRLGSLAIDLVSLVVTLLGLILLFLLIILWLWYRIRRWQSRQGKEISEAEEVVHESFRSLRHGLANYLAYLSKARSAKGIEERREKTSKELEKDLRDLERKIEKEIGDIKN